MVAAEHSPSEVLSSPGPVRASSDCSGELTLVRGALIGSCGADLLWCPSETADPGQHRIPQPSKMRLWLLGY